MFDLDNLEDDLADKYFMQMVIIFLLNICAMVFFSVVLRTWFVLYYNLLIYPIILFYLNALKDGALYIYKEIEVGRFLVSILLFFVIFINVETVFTGVHQLEGAVVLILFFTRAIMYLKINNDYEKEKS